MLRPIWSKRVQQLPDIALGHRLADSERFGFVRRATVGAEQKIHQWRDVGVIACFTFAGMMPMMQFRRANQHPQWTDGQPDVGMDVDGPHAAEGEEPGQRFKREPQKECGQID